MKEKITLIGKICFEPEDKTKKHSNQSSWKKIAMIFLDGDITEYYAWFIKKRFNLLLNKPLRGAHISFINDSMKDLSLNGTRSSDEIEIAWGELKKKWDGKNIEVVLDLNPKTNSEHWWLNVPHENRESIQKIRYELGLGKPYFGMHMSIGRARDGIMQEHSGYLYDCINKGFINFDN